MRLGTWSAMKRTHACGDQQPTAQYQPCRPKATSGQIRPRSTDSRSRQPNPVSREIDLSEWSNLPDARTGEKPAVADLPLGRARKPWKRKTGSEAVTGRHSLPTHGQPPWPKTTLSTSSLISPGLFARIHGYRVPAAAGRIAAAFVAVSSPSSGGTLRGECTSLFTTWTTIHFVCCPIRESAFLTEAAPRPGLTCATR
jgi:hypothetical protein